MSAWLLGATVGAVVLGSGPVARADWVRQPLTATGTTFRHEPPQSPVTSAWSNNTPTSSSGGIYSWPNETGATVEQKGSVVEVWEWKRRLRQDGTPDPADNPPARLTLKITANANAFSSSAFSYSDYSYSLKRDASKETATASGMDRTASAVDNGSGTAAGVGGVVLKSFPVDADGKATVTVPLEARAVVGGNRNIIYYYGTSPYTTPIQGHISASVYYYSAVDTRGVSLSRPGADHDDETYDPSTNTITGNTTYSYTTDYATGYLPSSQPNNQSFTASPSDNWSPNSHWDWPWTLPDTTRISNHKEMPYGNLVWYFDDSSQETGKWGGTRAIALEISKNDTAVI